MMKKTPDTKTRAFFAPEVVQTSSMDCGPAALKCLLEGFGIQVSYGRLREACQTDVDGTSIDTLETVANALGVNAEQHMLPADHLLLEATRTLPALVVVRQPSGQTHFVVIWRRLGARLQIMDPAVGRRWVKADVFMQDLFRHKMSVPAADWRDWARSDEFLDPMRERLARLGLATKTAEHLVAIALKDPKWFCLAALDASVRLVTIMVEAGGIAKGDEASRFLVGLFKQTCLNPNDIYNIIPPDHWSVTPDAEGSRDGVQHLFLSGAVLVKVESRKAANDNHTLLAGSDDSSADADRPALSPELAAALGEKKPNPLKAIWGLLATDGILAPATLLAAIALAVSATLIEALLMRGMFDVGNLLVLPSQRLLAMVALVGFMVLVLTFHFPIITESMRLGRRLDVRLRMALLAKMPRLTDRYFHSRPISDMADRSHSIQLTRTVPGMGIHFVQLLFELALTLGGLALIDLRSALFGGVLAFFAILVPFLFQPMINEADLRIRSHAGALTGFYLDALLGLVPIRVHRAERAVRQMHESLLVEWSRSYSRLIKTSLFVGTFQQVLCTGLAIALIVDHVLHAKSIVGGDLLLVYWTLKLPAIGQMLASLAHQYPAQRNVLLRLMEPLSAPEQGEAQSGEQTFAIPAPSRPDTARKSALLKPALNAPSRGASLSLRDGAVIAAGHSILDQVNLDIQPGEHVAIVGMSGAGKSSLLGLLLGWHRLAEGQLLIDGQEMDTARLDSLRRQIAWVDPAVQIWNKPFVDNLTFSARDKDIGRTANAIDVAQLRTVLQKLPQGLQTALGESGALLSGGEGQRVRLARALVQDGVRLALLDEPFRGMDRHQRSALLSAARHIWAETTLLCVTHDLEETLSFNRVLVVEGGTIVEDGNPHRLAATQTRYRDLLAAERTVRTRIWEGRQWRHLHVENGHVHAAS